MYLSSRGIRGRLEWRSFQEWHIEPFGFSQVFSNPSNHWNAWVFRFSTVTSCNSKLPLLLRDWGWRGVSHFPKSNRGCEVSERKWQRAFVFIFTRGKYGRLSHKNMASLDWPQQVECFTDNLLHVEAMICGP